MIREPLICSRSTSGRPTAVQRSRPTMVRLAQSYLRLGRSDRAKELLEEVVVRHSGAPISAKARDMLEKMAWP